ncbi:MAG: molecular chaperone HtpG [Micavibrio aeruginosavorus]|uniref:Chaperone protein HtpG n=1 Tax=Micavibrio aeruginosavorus TaxID=349221 RepID=A0A2W5HNQ7_9BACT|nr:MAG: molecular chaperone HtpG [Micavibrio aeruginosavorus]
MTENMNFGADVARLLEIVTHALYSNRDVFLRELVSNAADACDRLRYEAIATSSLLQNHPGYRVLIEKNDAARTLIISDTGIGMSKDEMVDHLGTIAKSGTKALMEQIKASGDKSLNMIGQFGVGFYSSFMVADKVKVVSHRAGTNEAWHWESDGKTGFTLREATEAEKERVKICGTSIILHIKHDATEFMQDHKITEIIKTYSNHVAVPVYLDSIDKEPINSASALWMKSKNEISEEQYKEFYNGISGMMGMDHPVLTSHWKAEGVIEYSALIYIPSMRPFDLFDPTRKNSVRLYVRRIFITDNCEGLIYPWLRFVRGVIDSEDLPLNVSREMLQHNPVVTKIRSGVTKRILSDLQKLAKDDKPAFETVWHQFGSVIKEGLYDATEHRDDIMKITRFNSTLGSELTSLEDYISRMKDGQEEIYYISGENVDALKNSPQIEGFKSRGLEVLLLKDTIDDFWLPVVQEYQGKKFISATKGEIDLEKFETPEQKEKAKEENSSNEKLLGILSSQLKDNVSAVRISTRLTDSPVCLIAGDSGVDLNMERVLKLHQQYEGQSKPVLEINPSHPLIKQLNKMAENGNSPLLDDAASLLFDQAKIMQGEPVSDPISFARKMADFMQKGLAA